MGKYVLKTLNDKNGRHIVRDGESKTLCGFSIKKGARFGGFKWAGQVNCRKCLGVHAKEVPQVSDW